MKKVAVIGATGMLGIPVTVELLNAGFEVTALVRDPEKATRILPERASLVRADVHDIDSLKTGLSGQDAVYLSLSIAPTEKKDDFHAESEGLQNILEAAHTNGIKRIGYLSAMVIDTTATHWWVLDIWRAATSQIKSSGIPYTIFYPTNFMETLAQRHVVGSLLALAGTSRFSNYWIAGRDYGAQVARSFQMMTAADREYFIQGPEAMTYDEAAHRFARGAKKRFRVVKLPLALLRCIGTFSQAANFNANVMETVHGYPEEFSAARTWTELGKPATTIEEFARSF